MFDLRAVQYLTAYTYNTYTYIYLVVHMFTREIGTALHDGSNYVVLDDLLHMCLFIYISTIYVENIMSCR